MTRPKVIGVTGGIATGKSTVLSILSDLGAEVIDADRVYHQLIAPALPLNRDLQKAFGSEIATSDGSIDRSALGRIVFGDPAALSRLDAITHPAVVAEIERMIGESRAQVVAVDAVKLIESGLDRVCDQVWIVTLDRESQISRLMTRNGISREEASRRVDAHPSPSRERRCADALIDNNGPPNSTRARVLQLWSEFAPLPISE